MRQVGHAAAMVVAVASCLLACGDDGVIAVVMACAPGETQACLCIEARSGVQVCKQEGSVLNLGGRNEAKGPFQAEQR
jgi:hypothetical protein